MEEEFYTDGNSITFEFRFDGIFTEELCKKVKKYDEIIFRYPTINKLEKLPKHIKSLTFYDYNFPVDNLHNGLLELGLYYFYDFPLNNLPVTLKEIRIPFCYKYPLDLLPDSLETLILPSGYTLSLENLPINIKELMILYNWYHNSILVENIKGIDKILPNLKIIKLMTEPQKKSLKKIREEIKLREDVKLEYDYIQFDKN